jgi:LacI family repressor for deo operon, udp, cdd, tsx, nupC, and nupG
MRNQVATIKDIADAAGVSVATVSRALAKPELVRPRTLDKISAIVERLEYTPNAMASSLRRKRSDTFLFVVPNLHNPFYAGVIEGVEHIAHGQGKRVLIGETRDQPERLDSYCEMLLTKQADGLLLIGELQSDMLQVEAVRSRVVMACEYSRQCTLPRVRIDNRAAAYEVGSYLLALGHRMIATITGPIDSALGRERLEGYVDALAEWGMTPKPEMIRHGDYTLQCGVQQMQKLLSLHDRPSAIFCANDEMAIGALQALSNAGIRVPHECSVIGFDDIRFAPYASPALTTVAQPKAAIGEAAMGLMLKRLAVTGSQDTEIIVPHDLVVRSSSGPPGIGRLD